MGEGIIKSAKDSWKSFHFAKMGTVEQKLYLHLVLGIVKYKEWVFKYVLTFIRIQFFSIPIFMR